jgi:hypothetical protein
MNKEEFLGKRYAIDLKLKELNGEKEQLEKEYIESNQVFPIGSKVCITVPAHERNNERILVPEAKKLAYIADYEIDDNGEVVPSLRQLDYNGGMSAIPLFVNLKISLGFRFFIASRTSNLNFMSHIPFGNVSLLTVSINVPSISQNKTSYFFISYSFLCLKILLP